jgi:hypothetical protein
MTFSKIIPHLTDLELWKHLVALCLELQYSVWRRSAPGDMVTVTPILWLRPSEGAERVRRQTAG